MQYAKQFATGTAAGSSTNPCRTSPGVEIATAKIIRQYQKAAMQMEMIITLPIFPRGMFISSAACGITSNPTNIAGTASITATKPLPSVNRGRKLSSPPVAVPQIANAIPPMDIATVAIVWKIADAFAPL